MKTIIYGLGAALILGAALDLRAQPVPPLINYQGQLLAANGNPLPTGDYEMEIQLFPVESGGAAVWGPQLFNGQSGPGLRPKVSAVEGRFNLVLGPDDTAGRNLAEVVAANPSLFLELKVGTGSPIAPRQQLLTAPYALSAANAHDAAKLGGYDWSSFFANGNPQTGNMGIGVAPSALKLDVNGRMRARQGTDPSAGIWFNQNVGGAELDRAFVGMLDDNSVGFYTSQGHGWMFTVNGSTGETWASRLVSPILTLGAQANITSGNVFGLEYFFINDVSHVWTQATFNAAGYNTHSDIRLKENIEAIKDPLETLGAIRGVTFNFKEDPNRMNLDPDRRRVGVLAQEVEKVLPEAVGKSPDGYLTVDYTALIPVLLQAVKEQQNQIDDLQKELEALKANRF